MLSSNSIRWGGLAAMLGGILGILYFPFHAVAYFATDDGAASADPAWVAAWSGAFRSAFEPLFTFAAPDVVYMTYGKVVPFVILGFITGLIALHPRQATHAGRLEKWGFRVAFVSTSLLFLGSIGEYWVGALEFSLLTLGGFPGIIAMTVLVGHLSGGLLLLDFAWVVLGYALYSEKVAPARQPAHAG